MEKQEQILIKIAIILVFISFLAMVASSVSELFALHPSKRFLKPADKIVEKERPPELRPEIHPFQLLPKEVEELDTRARQKIPGAEEYAAEAIYLPGGEAVSTRPLNVYLKVTYHSSAKAAQTEVKTSLKERYPTDNQDIEVDGQIGHSGYEANYGSFYIGWVKDSYSFEIDASFTMGIPGQRGDLLPTNAKRVARAVNQHIKSILRED